GRLNEPPVAVAQQVAFQCGQYLSTLLPNDGGVSTNAAGLRSRTGSAPYPCRDFLIRFMAFGGFRMASSLHRALFVGTALTLLMNMSAASAQTADEEEQAQLAADEAAQTAGDGSTLLPRLDVGAGAEGTAGTNIIAVTQEDLERNQPTDLQEVFSGEPAIAVGGAISSTQKIYVNGVDENNLAVTVDGSRQNNKVFHHNGTYLLDPALLKAV